MGMRLGDGMRAAVWTDDGPGTPAWRRALRHVARVGWLAAEGFHADACALRSSALTLASSIALVPALAVSFAVVRGLGWKGERLESLLLQHATILSAEAVSTVVSWVDHISIAGLGVMGALFAVGSALSLLVQVEHAFDAVWGTAHGRGRVRRAADAFALLVLAPVLVALAASSAAALRTSAVVAWLGSFGGLEVLLRFVFAGAWYAAVCAGFTALYLFLPAAPVERRAALAGGLVAGIAWRFAQSTYLDFQFGLRAYNVVYGALAQLPLLVFWMWASWALVLAGAQVAAAVQNLALCGRRYAPRLGGASERERLALAMAAELADASLARREAPTLCGLAAAVRMPVRVVAEVFGLLEDAGLAHAGGEDGRRCFLSLSPGSIEVRRIVEAARGEVVALPADEAGRPAVERAWRDYRGAGRAALGRHTLADLVDPLA